MPNTTTERPLRLCDVCLGLDDHPRHVQAVPEATSDGVPDPAVLDQLPDGLPARALADYLRPTQVTRHLDCCAALGCIVCEATEEITAGARGQNLIDTIANGALDGFEPPEVTTNEETGLHG